MLRAQPGGLCGWNRVNKGSAKRSQNLEQIEAFQGIVRTSDFTIRGEDIDGLSAEERLTY